ncbi:MAG: aminotransferase class V-fold PLP-dependent enzyme [Patescibacteria group bacterium]|nr:aminotransferase class V-fold PLP-dependent enzyme [Patescibacteria group bacterium]
MRQVYLDYAATTPTDAEVVSAMQPFFTERFGNPSSLYTLGQEARAAVENSRKIGADFLGAKPKEVLFTSGATESLNQAIKGVAEARGMVNGGLKLINGKAPHIITTLIEHHAVLHTCQHLERLGFSVTYLPVNQEGLVEVRSLKEALTDQTIMVSVMYVNNEVGTIQPIAEIGKAVKEKSKEIVFLTDAAQAAGYLDCAVDQLGVDMLAIAGHKIYAPKGVGIFYVRSGTLWIPQQDGGGQEYRRRAGTENVPYIVGLARAMQLVQENKEEVNNRLTHLRNKLIKEVLARVPRSHLNGSQEQRVPSNANFSFKNVEGESLLLMLDQEGIYVSTGSACSSGTLEPSHVLTAMGLTPEIAHGSLRVSLGKYTSEEDINYFLEKLTPIVAKLRETSPFK